MYQIKGAGVLSKVEETLEVPLSETRTFKVTLPSGNIYTLLFTPYGIYLPYDQPLEISFDGGSLLIIKLE